MRLKGFEATKNQWWTAKKSGRTTGNIRDYFKDISKQVIVVKPGIYLNGEWIDWHIRFDEETSFFAINGNSHLFDFCIALKHLGLI